MHHHLAVPPCPLLHPPCACTKGGAGGDRAIGREPATDMERSGMEVCTARVRKPKISCTPCACTKGGAGGDRTIGREPATDMERSGMEVCTARVRKPK